MIKENESGVFLMGKSIARNKIKIILWNFLHKIIGKVKILPNSSHKQSSDLESQFATSWKRERRKIRNNFMERASHEDLILAPWLGEIGYEILYWIPFLHRMVESGAIHKSQLTVVSRGGVSEWYKGISENYVEIYDYFTPEELNNLKSERYEKAGTQKLIGQDNSVEDKILARITRQSSLSKNIYYPSEFFNAMHPLFSRLGKAAPFRMASDMLVHKQIGSSESNLKPLVPSGKYICVNLYLRPSFSPSPAEYAILLASIDTLARKLGATVIELNSGDGLDPEHGNFSRNTNWVNSQTIYKSNPSNNLEWQSALISGSMLYIGTYGGPSYISLMYNVPTIALYSSREGLNPVHEHVVNHHKFSIESASWHCFSVKEFFEIFDLTW
jgi:hypothetical protein